MRSGPWKHLMVSTQAATQLAHLKSAERPVLQLVAWHARPAGSLNSFARQERDNDQTSEAQFTALSEREQPVAETSFNWKGWLFGLGLIVTLVLLALAPWAISRWVPSQSYTPQMPLEKAVIESLAEKPNDHSALVQAIKLRRELDEEEISYLRDPRQDTPEEAIKQARKDARSESGINSPAVWYEGLGVDDVRKIYLIRISGEGDIGSMIKSNARGYFTIYVGADDRIVGWHTTDASWRAEVIEKSRR